MNYIKVNLINLISGGLDLKKVLITATTASMIDMFNIDNIKILQDMGYQVDVAANFLEGNTTSEERLHDFTKELKHMNVGIYQVPFTRKVKDFKAHINTYKSLKKICLENNYDFIHTQNPIASVVTRVVARELKIKNIYMVHGFHFYKGASRINWLVYYPIEKFMAQHTDLIITINKEDYEAAKKIKKKNIEYVPGVGVNVKVPKISEDNILKKKQELGLTSNNILISVGELNENKNHMTVIKALSQINDLDFQYIIVGKGYKKEELENLIESLNLTGKVKLLGYRQDVSELLQISDAFIFPSHREGLSKALMEAMCVGLPVIASDIRGNTDLINDGKGGYVFSPKDVSELREKIEFILYDKNKQKAFGNYNQEKIKNYSSDKVNLSMRTIYENFEERLL